MKINSLKLTIQDAITKDKKPIAAVYGTVFIDNDEFKEADGEFVLDEYGEKIPVYETINFTTALSYVTGFKAMIQQMIIEALTLKNMEIAKENGELSHFVQSVGADFGPEKKPKGFRKTISDIKSPKKKALKTNTEPRKKAK